MQMKNPAKYLWGGRYIDDILMHREDTNGDGDFTDTADTRWWHLTDVQFSTIAILDDAANLQERIKYDSYGRALHHDWRDVDGDRDYDSTDRSAIATIAISLGNQIGDPAYRSEADLNRDGTIDSSDLNLATTNYNAALSSGTLSNSDVKNTIGWDGYIFNPEISAAGLYTVRFRWYSPDAGRWLERDPAGYARVMMNLKQYVISNPIILRDPSGLDPRIVSETWTFSGINNWCQDTGFTDYVSQALGVDSDHSFASICGTASDYNPLSDNPNSGVWVKNVSAPQRLNIEAETIAQNYRQGQFCEDGERNRIKLIMLAPKTNKRPSSTLDCCCDVDITLFWSPADKVPNQFIGIKESQRFWLDWTDDVYAIDNRKCAKALGKDSHSLEAFLCGSRLLDENGPTDFIIRPRSTIERAMKNSNYDDVWVCHSQGCNIAMHLLNRLCGATSKDVFEHLYVPVEIVPGYNP